MGIDVEIGVKAGAASWLAILTISAAIIGAAFEPDSDASLRDTEIELAMLNQSDSQMYDMWCRKSLDAAELKIIHESSNGGSTATPHSFALNFVMSSLKKDSQNGLFPVSNQLHIGWIYWCPFPKPSDFVRIAIEAVGREHFHIYKLYPGEDVLDWISSWYSVLALNHPFDRPLPQGFLPTDRYPHFLDVVNEFVNGSTLTGLYVEFDHPLFNSYGFEDTNVPVLHEPNRGNPPPVRLILETDRQKSLSLVATDVPGGLIVGGLSSDDDDYFGREIRENNKYSVQFEGKKFNFPRIRARLSEFNEISVLDAYNKIHSEVEAIRETQEFYGIRLPIEVFLKVVSISLVVLTFIYLSARKKSGDATLPDVVQDLPGWMRLIVCWAVLALLPALGMIGCAVRIQFVLPDEVSTFALCGLAWVPIVTIAMYVFRFKRQIVPSPTASPLD